MTPEQLEEILDGIKRAHRAGGYEAVAALALLSGISTRDEGGIFDFNQLFPLSSAVLPPQNLDAAMPEGWTVQKLDPWFQQLKEVTESDSGLIVQPPEGLSLDQLLAAWYVVRLFIDSGAVLRQNTEHNIEAARLQISERGLSSVLVVLDEQYRAISGLPYLWALSRDDRQQTVPAAILHGAPEDAGWLHTHAEALKWGQTLWDKGEVQGVLESSTPAEREFFQGFGFHQVPEITVLTLSWETFARLEDLITKQIGGKTNHDPAQLLFVEALREAVLSTRQRIIREGKGKPKDLEKLERHLRREGEMMEQGEKITSSEAWEWSEDESGIWSHPSMPKYRFKIVDPKPSAAEPTQREQRAQPDPRLMSRSQFQLLARDHFGIDADQASQLYDSESADSFNSKLRSYVPVLAPMSRRGPNGPSEEERIEQAARLALWNSR